MASHSIGTTFAWHQCTAAKWHGVAGAPGCNGCTKDPNPTRPDRCTCQ